VGSSNVDGIRITVSVPNMETLSPEQEDLGSFVGQTQDVAKDEEAV